jgi:hypothetical protein
LGGPCSMSKDGRFLRWWGPWRSSCACLRPCAMSG